MTKKFPRIPHLPWSPGGTNDDKRINNKFLDNFIGIDNQIVITEKMDGSNLCLTRDNIFARSHSGAPTHPSFDLAKKMHSCICKNIKPGFSIFGEWLWQLHSIKYSFLPSYFLVFHIRNDNNNVWLDWNTVKTESSILGFPTVPELFSGFVETSKELISICDKLGSGTSEFGHDSKEGIVIRQHKCLSSEEFYNNTAKWVRVDILDSTSEHWMKKPPIRQGLSETSLFYDLIGS